MKIALIVEGDPKVAFNLQTQLKLLGYITFIATTPAKAMNVVKVCKADLILISCPTRPHDRRSFAEELKGVLPKATIVLITNCEVTYFQARSLRYSGLSGVLRAPPTLTALWRLLESEREMLGCQHSPAGLIKERRTPP
jgi:DNA-binding NtrC family response regulator